jgi:hypothetical protein
MGLLSQVAKSNGSNLQKKVENHQSSLTLGTHIRYYARTHDRIFLDFHLWISTKSGHAGDAAIMFVMKTSLFVPLSQNTAFFAVSLRGL